MFMNIFYLVCHYLLSVPGSLLFLQHGPSIGIARSKEDEKESWSHQTAVVVYDWVGYVAVINCDLDILPSWCCIAADMTAVHYRFLIPIKSNNSEDCNQTKVSSLCSQIMISK